MSSGSLGAPRVGEVLEVVATEWDAEQACWRIHFLWRRWGTTAPQSVVFCTQVVAYRLVVQPGGIEVPPPGPQQPGGDTHSEASQGPVQEGATEQSSSSAEGSLSAVVTELPASSSSSSTP